MLEEYKKRERNSNFKTIETIVIDDPDEECGPGADEIIKINTREFNVGDKVRVKYSITKIE